MKKSLLSGIVCGAVVLSSAVMLSGCGRAKINASDYVTIKFSGYDNFGTASASIDRYQMMTDNPEAFGLDKGNELDELKAAAQLEESIDGKLDKTSELKNGDTVTFSWKNSNIETLEKNYKVKFTFDEKTATVEGLEAAKDYDPFENLDVKFKGFDGSGTLQNAYYNVDGGVAIELDTTKNGSLKNGDTVKAYIKGDSASIKKNLLTEGKNLTKTEGEFTVSGLEPIKEVDLFEYLTTNYEGTSPRASMTITQKEGAPVKRLNYEVSKSKGISNGDTIKITITDDYSKEGIKPTSTEKEYVVEGLPYYIDTISQLPEDVSKKMQNNNKDIFEAYVANDWKDPKTFKKMTMIGNYFIKPKEGINFEWGDVNNRVYFIYKISANDGGDPLDYYWVIAYSDIIILDDGTCSFDLNEPTLTTYSPQYSLDLKRWKTVGYRYVFDYPIGEHYVYGYKDIDSMFNDIITTKIDKYTYESTVKDGNDKKKD